MKINQGKKLIKGVSVIVITHNRVTDLFACLDSLVNQTKKIKELIIVDNNSTAETKKLVLNFQKKYQKNIKYYFEKKIGYAFARNLGFKQASYQWVAFIDDDCVAAKDWYEQILFAVNKFRKAAVIIGQTNTFFKKNIFSLTESIIDKHWKLNGVEGTLVTNYEVLDSKNIVYNQAWLAKHGLNFNEDKNKKYFGSCEDIDLGMNIFLQKGAGFYAKAMLVDHKDSTNFFKFIKKYILSRKSYQANIKLYYGEQLLVAKNRRKRVKLKTVFNQLTLGSNFYRKYIILLILSLKVMVDSLILLFGRQKTEHE